MTPWWMSPTLWWEVVSYQAKNVSDVVRRKAIDVLHPYDAAAFESVVSEYASVNCDLRDPDVACGMCACASEEVAELLHGNVWHLYGSKVAFPNRHPFYQALG
jgi:hypothetical protein